MVVFTVQRRVGRNAAGVMAVLVLLATFAGAEHKPELVIAAAANLTTMTPVPRWRAGDHPVLACPWGQVTVRAS